MPDLDQFPPSDFSDWEQHVSAGLKGSDFEGIIRQELQDGFVQSTYVDHTNNGDRTLASSYRNCNPSGSELGRSWLNIESVADSKPNNMGQHIRDALTGGADGFWIDLGIKGVTPALIENYTDSDCYLALRGTFKEILQFLINPEVAHRDITGSLLISDLHQLVSGDSQKIVELLRNHQGLRKLGLQESDGEHGSLIEISSLLSQAVWSINHLLDAGIAIDTAIKNIQFTLSIGDNYLWEICRLRCLRALFHNIALTYGATHKPTSLSIHVFTHNPMDSTKPLEEELSQLQGKGLISNTTQAMAAILGGCDLLTVVPPAKNGSVDANLQRISRNVSHILKHESFLDRVNDPVAGSYYLEELTQGMMKQTWSHFQSQQRQAGYNKKVQS